MVQGLEQFLGLEHGFYQIGGDRAVLRRMSGGSVSLGLLAYGSKADASVVPVPGANWPFLGSRIPKAIMPWQLK